MRHYCLVKAHIEDATGSYTPMVLEEANCQSLDLTSHQILLYRSTVRVLQYFIIKIESN